MVADEHAAAELATIEAPSVFVIDLEGEPGLSGDGALLAHIRSNPVAEVREAAVILLTAPQHGWAGTGTCRSRPPGPAGRSAHS